MSEHMSKMVRSMRNDELVERIEAFAYSTDREMLQWLTNEAKRRGM